MSAPGQALTLITIRARHTSVIAALLYLYMYYTGRSRCRKTWARAGPEEAARPEAPIGPGSPPARRVQTASASLEVQLGSPVGLGSPPVKRAQFSI